MGAISVDHIGQANHGGDVSMVGSRRRCIDWLGQLSEWSQSGLSLRAFAQREGLPLSSLYYHHRRQRLHSGGAVSSADGGSQDSGGLIDVTQFFGGVSDVGGVNGAVGQQQHASVSIVLPNGMTVVWPVLEDAVRLGPVVRALLGC